MCVIFFYVNHNPGPDEYKLILASNRDEFYARATLPAGRWEGYQDVIGGIDLQPGREGGSWLAISGRTGVIKVGALLNVTGEPKSRFAESRGMIVPEYMATNSTLEEYNKQLLTDCEKYSAFNFAAIELKQSLPSHVTVCSNAPKSVQTLEDSQFWAVGNSPVYQPFKKVEHGQKRFREIVNQYLTSHPEVINDECLTLLKDEQKYWPDVELFSRAPNWGEKLSAINVKIADEGYGSRTHTVILVDAQDRLHFFEETMDGCDPNGKWTKRHIFEPCFVSANC